MSRRLLGFVLAYPGRTLLLIALVTATLGAAAARVQLDNTPENWLPTDGVGRDDLATFRARFGEDATIVVFTGNARGDDPAWREAFDAFTGELRALDGVARVEAPRLSASSAAGSPPEGAASAAPSAFEPHLVGADGRHVAVVVILGQGLDPAARGHLVSRIDGVARDAAQRVGGLHLAGADVVTHDLDAGTAKSLGGLAPLVLLVMCAVFWLTTRSVRAVTAMLLTAVTVGTWTLGAMALAGRPLNLVIVAMPAILAVITAAYATHLLSSLQGVEHSDGDPAERAARVRWWRESVRATWRPCVLSAVTTAAGFAALATSGIAPIRDLGLFTALGVGCSLLLTFVMVPALLVPSRSVVPRPLTVQYWTPARAHAATEWIRRHATAVLIVGVGATLLGALGAGRLAVESHILRFFPEDHRVPRNYAAIEENLFGLTPFELVVEGPRARVLQPETVSVIDALLEESLAAEPLLRQVVSPAFGEVARGRTAEERVAGLSAALSAPVTSARDDTARFLWSDGQRVALRITLAARTGTSNECHALVERLRARLASIAMDGLVATVTGGPTLLIHGQVLLLETQLRSFALALLVVAAVIAAAFRSVGILLISLLPNVAPIALTLGLMGWLGIALDTATVTVAGIAIGLIVDDTIHILHRYASCRRAGEEVTAAVSSTLYAVGRPVLVTTIAVAAGFGAFALSEFPPTRSFGLLMAWTSLGALACDLLMLPALLLWPVRVGARRADLAAAGGVS